MDIFYFGHNKKATLGTKKRPMEAVLTRIFTTPKQKKIAISLHPSAENAYTFFHSQSFVFDKINLGLDTLGSLYTDQIFSVTRSCEDKYLLISGFEILGFSFENFDFRNQILVVYDELSEKEIEEKAWAGVFKILLSSMQENQLEPFRKSLNNLAPTYIVQKLFQSKKLTQKKLSGYTQISISGLKKQKRKSTSVIPFQPQNNTEREPKTILQNIYEAVMNVANIHKK